MTIKLDDFVHLWNKLLQSLLRMYGTYIPHQKFDLIKNSVLRDVTKIRKKSSVLKISKTFILYYNNIEQLLRNRRK